MIEQVFKNMQTDRNLIEKVIIDENLHYNHMVFVRGEGLPEHFSNSNVYMTVLRGHLTISLDELEYHEYNAGDVLKIPQGVKMNVRNFHDEILELVVVKAPAPEKNDFR